MKYINFEDLGIVIFEPHIDHDDMQRTIDRPALSAGFVSVGDFDDGDKVKCYGRSSTLNLASDPVGDTAILRRRFNLEY
jgi:hypothetical protein